MAYQTGFAESHTDLLSKIHTFLTSTMTPSGDRWVSQRNIVTAGQEEIIIKGVGSGTDSIYVGLKAYSDAQTDNYALILNSYTGFNNALDFYSQPGTMQLTDIMISLPLLKSVPADANAIKYWLVANSRRFIIIARTGSIYHQAYVGWGLPYGTPAQWPYPVIIGGSGAVNVSGVPTKQSETTNAIHAFWKPINVVNNSLGLTANVGNLAVKEPGGNYRRPYLNTGGTSNSACSGTWPFVEDTKGEYGGIAYLRKSLDDTNYTLNPLIIVEGTPPNIWGEFDGIRHITGFNLNSEDTITYSGDTWLCVENVFRTSDSDMVAVKLV